MQMAEEHEHNEQTTGKRGWFRRKKRFAIAAIVTVALLLLAIIWMRRDSDVNAVLSAAGFARLPESARNLKMDSQGSVFGMRVALVRFDADPEDMRHFIERSSIMVPRRSAAVMDIRFNAVVYPSWWPQRGEPYGQRTYFVASGRYNGIATVGNEMGTIYIQLDRESRLLRRIKRYIPFM